MKQWLLLAFLGVLTLVPGVLRAQAQAFPPITDEERALTFVPGEPNAPAVVLFRKGELLMQGYGSFFGSYRSHMRVLTREKILTESGRSRGEISIFHSESTRLEGFSGRTVLPDGTVVPVPAGAKFERKTSRRKGTFVTAVTFPSVQVGAILDYQYELVFDSPVFIEPWYFSDEELPVRRSEIVYRTAADWRMRYWSRSPLGVKIQKEEESSSKGRVLRVWAEDLPSLSREPLGPSFGDLAAQALLLPEARVNAFQPARLLESWYTATYLVDQLYEPVRLRDGGVAKQAREIAGSGTRGQKIEALYRFVRDEIVTEPATGLGIAVDPGGSLARILSRRRGNTAEKALLLQAMLKAIDVDSALVWAAGRDRGAIDPHLPNPNWFDAVFVIVKVDGQRLFLDPADPALGLGQIPASYEGTPALVPVPTKPMGLVLPGTPFEQNLRRTDLELTLDTRGRLAGTGTLLLTGHPAWEKISREAGPARNAADWKEWLASRFLEHQIADVKIIESIEERKITVTWTLAQRPEEVLGDEVSLTPSAPLGPLKQPFVQPASERRTGVAFDYPDREETVLHLCWPEGWKVESRPREMTINGAAGSLVVRAELQEGERILNYTRRRDLPQRDFTVSEYEDVRALFGAVETSDGRRSCWYGGRRGWWPFRTQSIGPLAPPNGDSARSRRVAPETYSTPRMTLTRNLNRCRVNLTSRSKEINSMRTTGYRCSWRKGSDAMVARGGRYSVAK
jgi:hypothetical protein